MPDSNDTSVEALEWVTGEQQTELERLWEIRGDWREWLPEELDSRSPGWRESDADALRGSLTELIPLLQLPSV